VSRFLKRLIRMDEEDRIRENSEAVEKQLDSTGEKILGSTFGDEWDLQPEENE